LTSNPLAMQLFHVALATGAAYLFLRYAPLSRLKRGLFVFGFFPFCEYGVIARCYSLGLLFAFAFCALFRQRAKRLLWMSVVLVGLANSSAYGLILALSLTAALFAAWVVDKREGHGWQVPAWQVLASALVVLAGAAVAAIRIYPPADSEYATGMVLQQGFSIDRVIYALRELPHAFFYEFGPPPLAQYLDVALLAALLLVFRKRAVPLVFFCTSTALILCSVYISKATSIWHAGHFVIAFAVALWLLGLYPEPEQVSTARRRQKKPASLLFVESFVILILGFQVLPNVVACYMEIRYPFSNGKAAAQYIRSRGLARYPIVQSADLGVPSVSGYLGKPIHQLMTGRYSSYVLWNTARRRRLDASSETQSKNATVAFARRFNGDIVVVACSSRELPRHQFGGSVGGFIQDCPLVNENYAVFQFREIW
jgi:hypothetical protein